ncbi:PREDICTED: protein SMG7 [Theobroma cacao]|uniref:Protein SMG7 n=1 Tax=Theobroma cacao TaxID=3641 RepID=A0AB32URQ3_THECC|nr:PREDICTED: protein SMG7 [Theobroma cacao]XP_007015278.2 PREDICTED: protein SMG7 [Theobroma cacao]XP_017982741.1 PREDICTED: protein SMG7 [Theobroma cacao]
MMIAQMDKMSAPSSRERAQRLYEKNIELENNRRRSAQARVPSDPNAWQQMRENYEAIILEDHAFSEQHNIEYALWQLHYKRIEELRAHYSAALASAGSNASQGVKVAPRPDRLTKIRLQFKTFLSEATGFYHELILKIRAKYGLPLGYFSDDSESRIVMDKDGKKSADIKKGLVSCHRCLIYLGDLARYKGLYGDGDSKSREYATASSYYLQAASIWPSSGNPHHQLAILASYSGDELVAVYRYFRSLAVDNPFSTARDNLIVAFEKNRHNCSQLPGDVKTLLVKEPAVRLTGKGRGKVEAKLASKDANMELSPAKEKVSGVQETYKSFCIRFVRLNGILFTRTSLETFADVLTLVSRDLCELLSAGPEEGLNFGTDAAENALFLVRLVSILIFTVHNLKRESEGQTYAEIVQRAALLQNAFTAVFELMGHVVKRCLQLQDVSSSHTLPAILVFLEWMACCPDVAAACKDVDEKQSITRSHFWKHCISFLNKILSVRPMCIDDDEDETCFFNMSRYEEGETENRLALWEDFELRGFLPLLPAHTILDFSRKRSFVSDGDKEKKARVKRILAAGKALANVIMVDQETVCFDSKAKKFLIGVEPSEDVTFTSSTSLATNSVGHETPSEKTISIGIVQPIPQPRMVGEEEDEDEVIVFKPPVVSEKRTEVIGLNWSPSETLKLNQSNSAGDLKFYSSTMSVPLDSHLQRNTFDASPLLPVSVGSIFPQHLQPVQMHASRWSVEEATSLANSLKGSTLLENGHLTKPEMQDNVGLSHPAARSVAIQQPISASSGGMYYSQTKVPETVMPSRIDAIVSSGVTGDSLAAKTTSASQVGMRKNPVSRPVRHLGPPPGFSPVPPKPLNESVSATETENPLMDDYSWLDGYQLTSSLKGSGLDSSINYASHADPQYVNNSSNGLTGTVSFPFPGKQVPTVQFQMEKQKGWQNFHTLEHLKIQHEQKLQQQQLMNGNQQFTSLPEQYQGQSVWTGRYFV